VGSAFVSDKLQSIKLVTSSHFNRKSRHYKDIDVNILLCMWQQVFFIKSTNRHYYGINTNILVIECILFNLLLINGTQRGA